MDLTVNVPTLFAILMAALGGVAWLIRMESKVETNRNNIEVLRREIEERATSAELTALRETVSALNALVNLTREQFHEYQLQVARDYVAAATVAEIKRDIVAEIAKMEARVEVQINRLVRAPEAAARKNREQQ